MQDDDEEDPRAELIRRLLEYETVKMSAEALDDLPRIDRDFQIAEAQKPNTHKRNQPPQVDLSELVIAFGELLARSDYRQRIKLSGSRSQHASA